MLNINTIDDIAALRETFDIECKLAQGRDGKGALPKDIWETYSAFANTQGGDIFLGLKEKKDQSFALAGIKNTQKVLDELWTCLNNKQKVSCNIIRDRWVKVLVVDGENIIQIHVPPASRKQKPVYINGNPLRGTYKRFNSADIRQQDETVRRMLAEQIEDSRDGDILKGYGIDDLDLDSFNQYRNNYSALNLDHPWNQVDAQGFLYNIGAWGKDRESGLSGITRAGLLMFGKLRPIKEAFPNYMLDYQERPEAKTETRWIDRFTLDGSWSGNVYDFYRVVIRKLTADLKVPFHLEGDQRQDDTLIHKALREAMVNSLVHADFSGRASVLIVKRPDMFGFRNPGLMRVPIDVAKSGGESDCRNRNLQDMFRYIGLGENAGSGLPKIFQGWKSQHWRKPILKEKLSPSDQTLLELHMLSLIPEKIIQKLRLELDNKRFDQLNEQERLVLVTAEIETTVDHGRMMQIMDVHPRDLSALFAGLVEKNLLLQDGSGRGTVYFLDGARSKDDLREYRDDFKHLGNESFSEFDSISGGKGSISGGKGSISGGKGSISGGNAKKLLNIASKVAITKRASKQQVIDTILELCAIQSLKTEELETLLNRTAGFIRKDYLTPLVKQKKLKLLYPTKPNHKNQAYISVEKT